MLTIIYLSTIIIAFTTVGIQLKKAYKEPVDEKVHWNFHGL